MDASNYQTLSARTLPHSHPMLTDEQKALLMPVLGLAGEAGEVVEIVKKAIFHGHELDKKEISKEIGDVAWYLASICTVLGLDIGEVMEQNIEKLQRRYPDGFSTQASQNRKE